MFTATDEALMRRALELAAQGMNTTHPNPRVGCVLVKDGHIVGEGWHRKAGEPHAEVHALRAAGERARGATAYVTLEPCSHFGRTPPCADALLEAGIAEVVVALSDPNPAVNGAGLARLQAAGIKVRSGLLEAEALMLNAGFVKRMREGLPLVRVKLGASLDGRTALANGVSQWITSEAARRDVQYWRARSSAILTGIGTVLADDPQLNVRLPDIDMAGRQPLRVVLDSQLRIPITARLCATEGTLVFTTQPAQSRGTAEVVSWQADPQGGIELRSMLQELAKRGCNEVLVEAGPTLAGRLLELGLADELLMYVAPVLLGDAARPLLRLPMIESMQDRIELELQDMQGVGPDLRLRYRIRH